MLDTALVGRWLGIAAISMLALFPFPTRAAAQEKGTAASEKGAKESVTVAVREKKKRTGVKSKIFVNGKAKTVTDVRGDAEFEHRCRRETLRAKPFEREQYFDSEKEDCGPQVALEVERSNGVSFRAEGTKTNPAGVALRFEYQQLNFGWREDVASGEEVSSEGEVEVVGATRLHPRTVGYEIGVLINQRTSSSIVPRYLPSVGLNFHLAPGKHVDPFLGPVVGYLIYDDLEVVDPAAGTQLLRVENEIALGFSLGVDVSFGRRVWAWSASVRYLWTSPRAEDGSNLQSRATALEVEVDDHLAILAFGLTRRF